MFHLSIHNYIQALKNVENKTEAIKIIDAIAQELGFEYFSYGFKPHLPINKPKFELVNSYPVEWVEKYNNNNYFLYDPTVLHGLKSTKPLVWDLNNSAEHGELWKEACAYGIEIGWSQSVHSPAGVSMLTLSRSDNPITSIEIEQKIPLLTWVVQIVNEKMDTLINRQEKESNTVELTSREVEVMKWSAEGKTSSEVSMILGISERTVTFHLTNVMKKLDANNKISATVKAVLLGLI